MLKMQNILLPSYSILLNGPIALNQFLCVNEHRRTCMLFIKLLSNYINQIGIRETEKCALWNVEIQHSKKPL